MNAVIPRSVMPITAAQVRAAITSNPLTKDFRHLESFPTNYLKRYSFKDPVVKAVKPQDRIKYWNIVPGDRVRIIGDKEGQVLEVSKVNKLSNRVYLKGSSTNVSRDVLALCSTLSLTLYASRIQDCA